MSEDVPDWALEEADRLSRRSFAGERAPCFDPRCVVARAEHEVLEQRCKAAEDAATFWKWESMRYQERSENLSKTTRTLGITIMIGSALWLVVVLLVAWFV